MRRSRGRRNILTAYPAQTAGADFAPLEGAAIPLSERGCVACSDDVSSSIFFGRRVCLPAPSTSPLILIFGRGAHIDAFSA